MLFNGKSSNQTLPLGCITAFWFTFYNEMLTNLACVTLLYLLVHLSIVYLSNSCFFSIAFNQFLLLPIFLYPFKFLDVLFDAKFFSQATKDKLKLDEEYGRKINYIQKLMNSVRSLQQQVQDTEEQHARNTQVFFFCLLYSWAATVWHHIHWQYKYSILYLPISLHASLTSITNLCAGFGLHFSSRKKKEGKNWTKVE